MEEEAVSRRRGGLGRVAKEEARLGRRRELPVNCRSERTRAANGEWCTGTWSGSLGSRLEFSTRSRVRHAKSARDRSSAIYSSSDQAPSGRRLAVPSAPGQTPQFMWEGGPGWVVRRIRCKQGCGGSTSARSTRRSTSRRGRNIALPSGTDHSSTKRCALPEGVVFGELAMTLPDDITEEEWLRVGEYIAIMGVASDEPQP